MLASLGGIVVHGGAVVSNWAAPWLDTAHGVHRLSAKVGLAQASSQPLKDKCR